MQPESSRGLPQEVATDGVREERSEMFGTLEHGYIVVTAVVEE
jgi:hypothetical protein